MKAAVWLFAAAYMLYFSYEVGRATQIQIDKGSTVFAALSGAMSGEIFGVKPGEALLFLATVFLVFVTRDLVDDARESSERQLRAYIAVEAGGLLPFEGSEGHCVAGHFRIRNVGKVIAKKVKWYATMEQSTGETRSDFPIAKLDGDSSISPSVSLPQATKELTLTPIGFIYVWGKVEYDDGFNGSRFTLFCHRYNRSALHKLAPSERYGIEDTKARDHLYGNDAI